MIKEQDLIMDRKKKYAIIISLTLVSILLTTNNNVENPYGNHKNVLENLKTSDSIAIYSPTSSTVVDLTVSTLITVEWSSGVAAACKIYLYDFSTEVEYLGLDMNGGRIQPGYINSISVDISANLEPGDYYRIKLVDINDQWNYDYSSFFSILNDNYNPPQDEDPPLQDPIDPVGDNLFMVFLAILIVAPIGIVIAVIITKYNVKKSEKLKPKTKSIPIKVLRRHIFTSIDEAYDFINQDQVEEASIRLEEIQKIIKEENNPKLTQLYEEKITHIKPIIENHHISQIKKVVLDLGIKVSLLELEEIIERTNLDNEELIENVINNMIKNSEIFGEYRSSIKTLFFNRKENTEAIDKLMKTYRDWEKTKFSKKM